MLFIVLIVLLPAAISAVCPTGCSCLPGENVRCRNGAVDRFPVLPSSTLILDLSSSRLASPVLVRTNFTGLTNLVSLTLKGCGISGIDRHAFIDMTKLKSLDLSINNLNILPPSSLTGLRLEYLYIEQNPNLRLQPLTFQGMTVEVLSLRKSGLVEVKKELFDPIINGLRKILLEGNKIERFSRQMLTVFESVESVRIKDNPLICDCESRWLKEFYDLNKDTNKLHELQSGNEHEPRCSSPDSVAGQFFSQLSIADFNCEKPTINAQVSFSKERGTLLCTARGNPTPSVSWRRPNGVISTETAPHGNIARVAHEIEIRAGELQTQGRYLCVASNTVGNSSFTINVSLPFQTGGSIDTPSKCNEDTTKEVDLTNPSDSNANSDSETNVLKQKYFTLVDIIGAILGTFVSTLIITVVTLHFCVYRRRKLSQYATPPMSEYSSSNASDKNGHYPVTLRSLQEQQMRPPVQRPLPNKPYCKGYDENHYMATNLDEQSRFIGLGTHPGIERITPASSCDACQACQTMPPSHNNIS